MNTLEKIKQQGNLFQLLMDKNTPVKLIRVYGYESKVGNTWLNFQSPKNTDDEEMKEFINILKQLRNVMNCETLWSDNKIVMEIEIGHHRVFIGYWDKYISVGGSIIPNMYPPHYRTGMFGDIEKIPLR